MARLVARKEKVLKTLTNDRLARQVVVEVKTYTESLPVEIDLSADDFVRRAPGFESLQTLSERILERLVDDFLGHQIVYADGRPYLRNNFRDFSWYTQFITESNFSVQTKIVERSRFPTLKKLEALDKADKVLVKTCSATLTQTFSVRRLETDSEYFVRVRALAMTIG